MIQTITTKTELNELFASNEDKLVVLDFYAEWCGPCKVLGETIETIHQEQNDFILAKIDVEVADELVTEFKVMNVPTLFFMKDNLIIDKYVGNTGKDKLIELIKLNNEK